MKKLLLCLVVLVGLIMAGCALFENTEKVGYEVTGTASSAYITMHNASGDIEELSNVTLPWSKEFKPKFIRDPDGEVDAWGDRKLVYFAYISAKNNGSSGNITVKIFVDGKERKTASSEGAHVTAAASAKVVF